MRTLDEPPRRAGGRATMRARRFGTARHVADLFDRYGVHRPAMIEAWAAATTSTASAGRSRRTWCGRPSCGAGCGTASVDRARPSGSVRRSPRCGTTRRSSTLPRRLALFGLTRLAPSVLRVARRHRGAPRCAPVPAAPVTRAVGPRRER